MAIDPICQMEVDEATAPSLELDGQRYFFCCSGCQQKFASQHGLAPKSTEPAGASCCSSKPSGPSLTVLSQPLPQPRAASPKARFFCPCCPGEEAQQAGDCGKCGMPLQPNPAYAETTHEYTCPMHPEVKQTAPGTCPKCGMDLEPSVLSAESQDDMGFSDMLGRLRWSIVLTLPVLVLAMGPMVGLPIDRLLSPTVNTWLQFLFCTPLIWLVGWPIWKRAWQSVVNLSPNMFTLIAMGTATAYFFSLVVMLAPGALPEWLGPGAHHVYFEAASVIVTLVLLGQVLEIGARSRVQLAIKELLSLTPETAYRLDGDREVLVAASDVRVDDSLKVYPGQKIPVDGLLTQGESFIDESMVTGEADPVMRRPGDAIVGGTLNQTAAIEMKAQQVGENTLLSRIIELVAQAQRSRAPIQALADRVASWFVPAVIAIAVVTMIFWLVFGPAEQRLASAMVASVSVLLIACPCALGLATPISIMVGVGRAAQSGILMKNGESIQTLAGIETLVFDKTGTLTVGRPEVTRIEPAGEYSEFDLLIHVAAVEQSSEHPLAKAVVRCAESRVNDLPKTNAFENKAGRGVQARVGDELWRLGSPKWFEELGIAVPESVSDQIRQEVSSVILACCGEQFVGWLTIRDELKPTSQRAVQDLKAMGIEPVMLTGDRKAVADQVARDVGIDKVFSEVDPVEKQRIIQQLQSQGRSVAMAGDGINDAPALAAADVGVAMGTGTDVAIESADISLIRSDLSQLVFAIRLSRKVVSNIKQNLWFAFGYNAAGIPIAAGVLYPWLGIMLSPMLAAALMSLSSVSVIGNALRLRVTGIAAD